MSRWSRSRRVAAVAARAAVASALVGAGCGPADDSENDEAPLRGLRSTPTRIALTPTAHPRRWQAFAWRTNEATKRGFVQVRRGGKTRVIRAGRSRTVSFPGWGHTSRHHAALVRRLRPDTRYRYRVGVPGAWSGWRAFRTAHGPHRRWQFAYFGDAQRGLTTTWPRTVDRALRSRDVDLMLHAGDLVDEPTHDAQWSAWFRALHPYRRTTTMMPAVGNHELREDKRLWMYRAQFRLPQNGPAPTTYAIDYQGVRFVVLDANRTEDRAQRRFLRKKLHRARHRWTVVLFHKPMFASTRDRDTTPQRAAWLRILERQGADLVLEGHDHVYARGYLRRSAGAAAKPRTSPMYAVADSGGKYYSLDGGGDWASHDARRVEAAENVTTYQLIRVSPRALTYRSIVSATGVGADHEVGEVIDRFRVKR
ncbi:MAG TPA: metallophosphoesterase family protein [Nocardioidaceae bacterium]|nr:metallophosphoesterase family protein [Nocardioidaceae bacterium]